MAKIVSENAEAQWQKQGGLCCWCLKPMDRLPKYRSLLPPPRPLSSTRPTLEHVVPRYYYGSDAWTNIVLAHSSCNGARGRELKAPHFALPDALARLEAIREVMASQKNKNGDPVPPSRLYLHIPVKE